MRWVSRLVKLAVTVAIVAAFVLIVRAKMPATEVGEQFTAWALFRDGSRLALGSPVRIAGVRIGEVDRLTIVGDFARIDLRLRDDTDIPIDSWITKRAESAFGDSYLEIIPAAPEAGAPTMRKLRSGEQLVHVEEGSSTDTTLRTISRAMPKIDDGLETVHDFALGGRKWANSVLVSNLESADRWLAEGHIDRPIANARSAVEGFEHGTERAAQALTEARPDFDRTLDRYNRGLVDARKTMADAKVSMRDGFASARDGMDRVDQPIQDLEDVLAAIDDNKHTDDWKGTLGKLVNDPKLADDITDFTDDAAAGIGGLNKLKSWLGLRGELNLFGHPRVYLTAEIRSRNDKFYLIEIEKGPLGSIPADQLHDVVNAPQYNRYQQIDDGVRYTAQFGKTVWSHLQLRGGIKESTFGIGADLLLNRGKLRLESDLYGSFQRTPRLKVSAALAVFRSLYILGGIDDALNEPGRLQIINGNSPVPQQFLDLRYGRDYFIGAALHFDDLDLTAMIRTYGAILAGALR